MVTALKNIQFYYKNCDFSFFTLLKRPIPPKDFGLSPQNEAEIGYTTYIYKEKYIISLRNYYCLMPSKQYFTYIHDRLNTTKLGSQTVMTLNCKLLLGICVS